MKTLFLLFHGFEEWNIGIGKKITYQKNALIHCGLEVELCYLTIDQNGYHKRMIDSEVLENYGKGFLAKIKKRICYSHLTEYILNKGIKFLYIRSFHNANPLLIRMIKKISGSGIKIVMEIPTYPYDFEYKNISLSDHIRITIDKIFRRQLAKYINHIVTFANEKTIFGIPAINISNGIDFANIKMKTKVNRDPRRIRLIGVAEIHFWHGFDRVLAGMGKYYQKKRDVSVFFDIVGAGVPEELNKLMALSKSHNLEKFVTFHGAKSGDSLDQLFEEADMGIASLGRHRSQITHIKPLKNREYAARGIPFVYSEIDDDFEHMPYIMKAPPDETPLDIEKIVVFFFGLDFRPIEIRETIIDKLSWDTQMKRVVEIALNKKKS